jgi:hypothetical protein
MPALHGAVLDHQPDAAPAGVLDQRGEDRLGVAEVLGHGPAGVAADERAHQGAAEGGGCVDAGVEVLVGGAADGGVGVQVVVVVGERRQFQAVLLEQGPHLIRLVVAEVGGVDVAGHSGAVAGRRPGRHLERVVVVGRRPAGDVAERQPGQAGGEEAELHRV